METRGKVARVVWNTYLEELAKWWTKMQKLSVIYMKQSFAFVQLGSLCICLPFGPRSVVLELQLCMPVLVPFPFFSFLQKVSGQQILEICIKDFVWICCSHPCFKESSNSKDSYSMDHKMLAIIYFIIFFFRERDLFWKDCSPFFFFSEKLKQG